MTVTHDLEAILKGTERLTEDEIVRTMRIISNRAWQADVELHNVVKQLGEHNAEGERIYDETLILSEDEHPERKRDHHIALANRAAAHHKDLVFALTHMERFLHKELEILDRLVTSCQSMLKRLDPDSPQYERPVGARRAS